MSSAQRVLIDVTDTLLAYPQVSSAAALEQASSATVRIRTASTSLPDAGVSATVDTVSGITSAEAAEGDVSLALTASVAAVRGRRYLLGLTTGEVFVVQATKSGTTATVQLAEPLPCVVAAGSTLKGFALTKQLTSGQVTTIGEGLALFTAALPVAGSVTFAHQFRIVRRIPRWTLTSTSLTTGWPILHQLRPRTDVDFTETLQAVWDNRLLPALQAKGIAPETIFSPEQLEPVHGAMVVHHLLALDPAREGALIDRWQGEADQALTLALAGKDFWVDPEEETAVRDEDAPPADYRSTRWTR